MSTTQSWKNDEILCRTGRVRHVGPGISVISSDTPTVFQLSNVPLIPRKGFHHSEDRQLSTSSSSSSGGSNAVPFVPSSSAGPRLTSGVLQGSAVNIPPLPQTARPPSIVLVDEARQYKRYKDPYSVESMHRSAMSSTGAVTSPSSSSSNAFHSTFGAPNLYVSKGVHDRAITPVYGSHQRLSALESTLAGLQLWNQTSQRHSTANLKQSLNSNNNSYNDTTNQSIPLPIGTQLGTTRFDGTLKPISNNTQNLGTTNILRNPNIDSHARKAYTWTPSSLISPLDTSAAVTKGLEKGLLLDVPEPHAILRPRADKFTYTSRSSAQGITSRGYMSNLDHTLTALIVSRGESGVMDLPSVRNNNNNNSNRSSLNPSPTGNNTATNTNTNTNSNVDEVASFEDIYSPIVGHNNTKNNDNKQQQQQQSDVSATMDILDEMQGTTTTMEGGGNSSSSTSSPSIFNPVTTHMGGNSWTTRKTYSLARMENGPELLRSGAMQARFTYRMGPRHNTDLNHGFVENGTWHTMNFRGDTGSPVRRSLQPLPLGNNLQGKEDITIDNEPVQPSSPGFQPSNTNNSHTSNTNLPPVLTQTTALGKLLQERFLQADNAYNTNINTVRNNAILSSMQIKPSDGKYTEEMSALNNFDDAHDMGNPTHWPKKVLRIKISQSGVAHLIGMDPITLEKADKAALLAAYERIPSTKRMLELLNQRNNRSSRNTNSSTTEEGTTKEDVDTTVSPLSPPPAISNDNGKSNSSSRPSSQGRGRSSRPSSRGNNRGSSANNSRTGSKPTSRSASASSNRPQSKSRPASSSRT